MMNKNLIIKLNMRLLPIIYFATFLIFPVYSLPLKTISIGEPFSEDQKEQNLEYFDYLKKNKTSITSSYLLGKGDIINLTFFGVDIFDGNYAINTDGYLNLPEIGSIRAEGYSVQELSKLLVEKYKDTIKNPKININIAYYRPVSIFISGEVKTPGLYDFDPNKASDFNSLGIKGISSTTARVEDLRGTTIINTPPRLFDVIKRAKGVSNYANLSEINIVRNNSILQGGGRIKAKVNFLKLIKEGDQTQNIVLHDGDYIEVPRGSKMIKEQVLSINKSNLSPDSMTIYITGNVVSPGSIELPQGSSLVQAVGSSGGKKMFTGTVEFLRFNDDGTTIKKAFKYNELAPINSDKNPILMSGDIINVRKTILGSTSAFISEIGSPIFGGYGLYRLISD